MNIVKKICIEIEEGLKATGLGSTNALMDYALRDLVHRESQKRLLRLQGAVAWEGDIQAMRCDRQA